MYLFCYFLVQVHTTQVIRCLLAEFFGTLLLVLIGCGSCMGGDRFDADVQLSDQVYIWESSCMGGDRSDADVQLSDQVYIWEF